MIAASDHLSCLLSICRAKLSIPRLGSREKYMSIRTSCVVLDFTEPSGDQVHGRNWQGRPLRIRRVLCRAQAKVAALDADTCNDKQRARPISSFCRRCSWGTKKPTGCKSVVPLSTGSRRHIPKDSRNHGPEDDRSTRLERLREAHEQPNCRALRASPAPDACCAQTYRRLRTAKNARRALVAIHIVTKNQPPSYSGKPCDWVI